MNDRQCVQNVIVFHPEGNIHQNPTLWSAISSLAEEQCHIVLVICGPTPSDRPGGNVTIVRRTGLIRYLVLGILRLWLPSFLRGSILALVHRKENLAKFDVCIGIDREGLIEGYHFARSHGARLVFFSFELMFREETSPRFKSPELLASQQVSAVLVQDERRGRLLEQENSIPGDKLFFVPLAPKGRGSQLSPRLRDQCGIPAEKRVALLMGSLEDWTGFSQLLGTLDNWPDSWVLLVNSRSAESVAEGFPGIAQAGDKVYSTSIPAASISQMSNLLAGIDLGFAFYLPTRNSRYVGRNIEHIGLSSGKTAMYLSYGIPVLANFTGEYAKLIADYDCGALIDDFNQIPPLLDRLDVERLGRNAFRLFDEKLDYAIYERLMLEKTLGIESNVAPGKSPKR